MEILIFKIFRPEWLVGLVLVIAPPLFFFFAERAKRRIMEEIYDSYILACVRDSFERKILLFRALILSLVFLLLILGLADVRIKSSKRETVFENTGVVFVLDVSPSMRLEEDFFGPYGRLGAASREIDSVIGRAKYKYKIGGVFFAGDVLGDLPFFSLEYKQFLDSLNFFVKSPSVLVKGSNFEGAIKESVSMFKRAKDLDSRFVIFFSDGEEDEFAPTNWESALEEAKRELITFFTVKVGKEATILTEKGEPLRDPFGKIIISSPSDRVLKRIAEATGGIYFDYEKRGELAKNLEKVFSRIEKFSSKKVMIWKGLRDYFFWTCFIFFILYLALATDLKKIIYRSQKLI